MLLAELPAMHFVCLQISPVTPAVGSGGATPLSQAGFKHTVAGKGQQLTLAAVEVHADSRYGTSSL